MQSSGTTVPRALILDHTAREGGAETALARLLNALPGAEDRVRVLLFEDGPLHRRLHASGVQTAVVELDASVNTAARSDIAGLGAIRAAWTAVRFVPRLVRAIRGADPEIVVANSLKSAVFTAVAAPLAGRRWAWHLHDRLAADYLPRTLVALMRGIALCGPTRIVVNSEATRATLPHRAQKRCVVAYPGLDDDSFTDQPPVRVDPPTIGMVGRISPTKGQTEFIRAAALVARDRPDTRFVVIGDALFGEDGYRQEAHDLAAALGVDDRIDFTGWVDDAPTRMSRMSVVVHASPVPEPFGQVIVEAMARGVPVVATATGGVSEILQSRTTPVIGWQRTTLGIVVTPADHQALAGAITDVLSDPEAAEERAAAARRAAEAFRISSTAQRVIGAWSFRLPRSGTIRYFENARLTGREEAS